MRRVAAGALFFVAGCSQLTPYQRPPGAAAAVDAAFPADLAPGGAARPAAETPWREFFRDPRLAAMIGQGLESNRDLAVAVLRIEEARAQYRIVRADRLPGINLSSSVRVSEGSGGTGVNDPTDPGGGTGGTGGASGGGDVSTRFAVSVGVSAFELDFWGRVRALSAAARAAYLQTEEARRAFEIGLIADIAEAHLADRALAERARLTRETIASRRESLRLAGRLFEEGEGSRVEVAQERALLGEAQVALATTEREARQNQNLLQLLVGRPLDGLPPPRPFAEQGIVADIPAGLPSDLIANRPDIRATEQALVAAGANIGAARAAFFPRISLTGSLGFADGSLEGLFAGGPVWSFVPQLLAPIFDAGRNRAGLDLARAREAIALAQYERAIQGAFREVADALAARRYLGAEITARRAVAAAQADRVRLAALRFAEGEASAIEVLDARREEFAAQQSLIEARRAELANAVTLYAALGGGLR